MLLEAGEDARQTADAVAVAASSMSRSGVVHAGHELEEAAIGWHLLKCVSGHADKILASKVGNRYGFGKEVSGVEAFRQVFLLPFCQYVDEQLDEGRLFLYTLRHYKHACEWFNRGELYSLWKEDTAQGELRLCVDLYRYLHDNGIEFQFETKTASGRVDLLAEPVKNQVGEGRVVADAKIFDPSRSKGKSYITKAFNQTHVYACDYNEPFGYVVIYNVTPQVLDFPSGGSSLFPSASLNGKTIFFIVIDISDSPTASKRKAANVVTISQEDLMQAAEEAESGAADRSE